MSGHIRILGDSLVQWFVGGCWLLIARERNVCTGLEKLFPELVLVNVWSWRWSGEITNL